MQWFRHARRSATTVIAACVAVAAVAAVSYAATSELTGSAQSAAGGRLYACVTARFQTLNLSSAGAACPAGQRKVSWNIRGRRGPLGPVGRRGPNGSRGPQGLMGARGDTGPKGNTGETGPRGNTGDTGPQGPAGRDGVTGPPGSLASAYLDAYNSSDQTVALDSDLRFDTLNVTPVGISTNAAHSAFTVSNAGSYLINVAVFRAVIERFRPPLPETAFVLQLTVNNALVRGPLAAGFSRILSLNADDVVTVRQVADIKAAVPAGAGITIVRIS